MNIPDVDYVLHLGPPSELTGKRLEGARGLVGLLGPFCTAIIQKNPKKVSSELLGLIRHSRLPAGNALWVCQNFFFFFFFFFYSSAAKVSG